MALFWNPWGTMAILALAVAAAFAWFVYRAGPRRPVNIWLSLLILLEGLLVATCDDGIGLFVTQADHYYGTAMVHATIHIALPFVYLIFLGHALDTPLVRPFRSAGVAVALLAAMLAWQVYRFANPDSFIAGLAQPWFAPWGVVPGPGFLAVLRFSGLVAIFGLVAALDAWRRAKAPTVRRRARAYAAAFAIHDAYWAILLLIVVPHTQPYESRFWGIVFTQSMPALTMAFVALLGYGILSTQMLDIDLKLKWTLSRGTLAAAFLAVFFLVSEGTQLWLSNEMGPLFGLLAAGLLVFALAPLQRLADRLADRTMPGVNAAPDYLAGRRRAIYQAAVEQALEDGDLSDKDRRVLAALQDELALSSLEARALEAAARGVPA